MCIFTLMPPNITKMQSRSLSWHIAWDNSNTLSYPILAFIPETPCSSWYRPIPRWYCVYLKRFQTAWYQDWPCRIYMYHKAKFSFTQKDFQLYVYEVTPFSGRAIDLVLHVLVWVTHFYTALICHERARLGLEIAFDSFSNSCHATVMSHNFSSLTSKFKWTEARLDVGWDFFVQKTFILQQQVWFAVVQPTRGKYMKACDERR